MGIQRAVIAVVPLVVLACGPGARTAEPPGEIAATTKPLCIDPDGPGGDQVLLSYPYDGVSADSAQALDAILEPGWRAVGATPNGTHALIVREGCDDGGCDPHLVRIADGKVTHSVEVPGADTIPEVGSDPFAIMWITYLSDEDGNTVLWLSYTILGEPEPAVGSTTRIHVAAFAPDDLALRFHMIQSESPEASSLDGCVSDLASVDANCDEVLDYAVTTRCRPQSCNEAEGADSGTECAEPHVEHTIYLRGPDGSYVALQDQP